MKKLFLALALVLVFGQSVYAHELLPAEVQRYIQEHPQATQQEIQAFIASFNQPVPASLGTLTPSVVQEKGFLENSWDFVRLGFEHILTGPDHILFVLALLLAWVSIREILKLTGTFTIAHSITFILAGSGFFVLSARIVEPLIALSISYVALVSVFVNKEKLPAFMRHKIPAVFFFGLFHGLGFAGLLSDLSIPVDRFLSSLIAFNVGIEIGQVFVIALAVPFVLGFKNKSWYADAERAFACIIAIIGLFWFVQRIIE